MSIGGIIDSGSSATNSALSGVQRRMLASVPDPQMRQQLQMQFEMARMNELVQLFSNMLKKVDEMNMAVIGNLK